jgi:beta-glucosidase
MQASRTLRTLVLSVFVFFTALCAVSQEAASNLPYKNSSLPVEQRVSDLLGRMTLEEKASMLTGAGWMESVAVPRLGIPSIKMADGPMGVRSWLGSSAITSAPAAQKKFTSTAFPAGIAVAATWDPMVAQRIGKAIAEEVKAAGRDMILAPTVNIQRVPLWGRNFEGYGEDPYLAAKLGVGYIKGVQGEGVIASVKHFAANNEEFERHRIDEKIDERTLNEIYFPAFKAAVQQADVWAVMSAYNKVNGTYCAENSFLLRDVLKKKWGFKGFVISDWGSTYSTAATVNSGMDLEMPGGERARTWLKLPATIEAGNGGDFLSTDKVLAEVKAGIIPVSSIDDNVSSILRIIFVSGQFDHPHTAADAIDSPEHRTLARSAAAESIVLLKNAGNVLPLDSTKIKSIAVIGPNAAVARTGGGGSSKVNPTYIVTPLDGIKERAGSAIPVNYAIGNTIPGEVPANDTLEARERLRSEALAVAAKSDVAIVFVGDSPAVESEGFDRKTLDLPEGQDELIAAIAKVNRNTIVVFNSGGPVNVRRFVNDVPALVGAWFGGQELGHAVADVLFGDVDPSGKLPFSFINEMKQSPAYGNYPGDNLHVTYAEGIYVGYRYFDKQNVAPQFPFGHGLSYTSFDYSKLKVAPGSGDSSVAQVTVTIRNSGKRAGAEVVQLYIHDGHSKIDRPVKELKGFERVDLKAGESKNVTFTLDRDSFAYYSMAKHEWIAEPGKFEILVGASSRDIRSRATFDLAR